LNIGCPIQTLQSTERDVFTSSSIPSDVASQLNRAERDVKRLFHRGTEFAQFLAVTREVGLIRPVAPAVTDADELFVNLDGTELETPRGTWRVEICGIHSDNARNWVQLCLRSETSYGLTVRVDHLSAAQVRSAVSNWLSSAALP